jgi:CubicO group peptidase (beta-lactamase class C family)
VTPRPELAGFDPKRLARIDDHLRRRYLEPGKIAGALPLVWRRGELAWLSPVGHADRERGVPMGEDTIFRIFSMTKPITSVALMMLFEEGHFQLDDPVHKTLPAWRDLRVFEAGNHPHFATRPCERPMTIRHLLTHTSGLTYGFMERTNVDRAYRKLGIGTFGKGPGGDLAHMVALLAGLPLEFQPGSAWNYSVSTDVCGHLVERFSGQRFDAFLEERIFRPLGMRDTAFFVPEQKVARFAANYERGPAPAKELRLLDDPRASRYLEPPVFLGGGGGLVSTAHDYLRFCRMLLAGGELEGQRILSRKTLGLMTANHLPGGRDLTETSVGMFSEVAQAGTGFGLGFSVLMDPVRAGGGSRGTYAWGGAASTIFWVDPAEELIVIFMTQLFPSQTFDFRGQLRSLVYGALAD